MLLTLVALLALEFADLDPRLSAPPVRDPAPDSGGASFRPSSSGPALRPKRVELPSRSALAKARRYAGGRSGAVSFAVADARGRIRGLGGARQLPSASLVKAMIMVAYLNRIERREEELTGWGRARLEAMIRWSDNAAAGELHRLVGSEGLMRVSRRVHMRHFIAAPAWGSSTVTANDQVRFFVRVDRLVRPRHRGELRRLLRTVVPAQRWGIPDATNRRWTVLFKGGWRPTARGNLVNQAAKLERGSRELAIAVLSDGNPSHEYGTETVRGIAARLAGR